MNSGEDQTAARPVGRRNAERVAKPAIVGLVDKLPKHPTLPPYEPRSRPISMIVIHHTDTTRTTTVQTAQYHVYGERRDFNGNLIKAQWPGVGYHFLVGADGVIYQGQRDRPAPTTSAAATTTTASPSASSAG